MSRKASSALVIGGSGFLGRFIVKRLSSENYQVSVLDFHSDRDRIGLPTGANIEYLQGDFFDQELLSTAVNDADVVIHLLSSTVPGDYSDSALQAITKDIATAKCLFRKCSDSGTNRIVFASSGGAVYGPPNEVPIPETHPRSPVSPYGAAKAATERLLASAAGGFDLNYLILRIANVYGENWNPKQGHNVIATWLSRLARQEPIEIWGSGNRVRDYIHIEDAALAFSIGITRAPENTAFNIGSGRGVSLIELRALIEEVTGEKLHVTLRADCQAGIETNVLDISRAADLLGWQPRISLADGIERTWNWIKQGARPIEM